MKTNFILFAICILFHNTIHAQAVGIGTASPNASAMLDVTSTTKGFLMPRMTSEQRIAIASPTAGLTVYETTTSSVWVYNGSAWVQMAAGGASLWAVSGSNIYNTNAGAVGIGTSTPNVNTFLHVDLGLSTTKGLLVTGTYNSAATVPDLGAGPRLMFYPGKSAFRAGRVTGTEWDNANVGLYSLASGYNTTASEISSTAMGHNTTAEGVVSTAMGINTTASGGYSTAMGSNTTAAGYSSTSMGEQTSASGSYSTAMGNRTTAKGYASTVIGMYNDSILTVNQGTVTTTTPLFIMGNGDNNSSRSNAMVVLKNGNVGVGSNAPGEKLVLNATSSTTIQLQANDVDKGFVQLSGDNLRVGTNSSNAAGKFIVRTGGSDRLTVNSSGEILQIAGHTSINNGGTLSLEKTSGLKTVEIKPTESGSDGASMLLYNNAGVVTIEMDADYADGDGRVITSELQITGGSDLAENFDITGIEESEARPGMLVSIDTKNEGKLCITSNADDKALVGVISGANGIKPGMLMGQQGTIAFGKFPVALAGRVYVLTNTEGGEINAGDFLTSSAQKGYAKKAANLADAQGSLIGKAMGSTDTKTGLVLVLINLQ